MSVEELRGQIAILLRKIDLLERQGQERESEVGRLHDAVKALRTQSADLLGRVQPPTQRELALRARLEKLTGLAQTLQRQILDIGSAGADPTRPGIDDEQAPGTQRDTVSNAVPGASFGSEGVAARPPEGVLFGARWAPDVTEPGSTVSLHVRAPGFADGTPAMIEIVDEDGLLTSLEEEVSAEDVTVSWAVPSVGGPRSYRFSVRVGHLVAESGRLDVQRPAPQKPEAEAEPGTDDPAAMAAPAIETEGLTEVSTSAETGASASAAIDKELRFLENNAPVEVEQSDAGISHGGAKPPEELDRTTPHVKTPPIREAADVPAGDLDRTTPHIRPSATGASRESEADANLDATSAYIRPPEKKSDET